MAPTSFSQAFSVTSASSRSSSASLDRFPAFSLFYDAASTTAADTAGTAVSRIEPFGRLRSSSMRRRLIYARMILALELRRRSFAARRRWLPRMVARGRGGKIKAGVEVLMLLMMMMRRLLLLLMLLLLIRSDFFEKRRGFFDAGNPVGAGVG